LFEGDKLAFMAGKEEKEAVVERKN